MTIHRTLRRATALALLLPALAGCATQQQLGEYQDEIARLRENNSKLQRDNDRLRSQLDSAESQLINANMRVEEALSAPDYPDLAGIGVDVTMRGDALVISIPSAITFASGSADLSPSGQDAVRAVARVLSADYPSSTYWIEGHTDSDKPSRSKFESNRQLSVERAMTVLQFLVNQCDLPDANCVVAGHGEYTPVAGNETPAGKAQNRRVEIVVQRPRG